MAQSSTGASHNHHGTFLSYLTAVLVSSIVTSMKPLISSQSDLGTRRLDIWVHSHEQDKLPGHRGRSLVLWITAGHALVGRRHRSTRCVSRLPRYGVFASGLLTIFWLFFFSGLQPEDAVVVFTRSCGSVCMGRRQLACRSLAVC